MCADSWPGRAPKRCCSAFARAGCNGYQYDLSFVTEQMTGVRTFHFGGLAVFVAEADWALVQGTEIDYVTEGLNAALTFKNPNATSECGCGESFSIAGSAEA